MKKYTGTIQDGVIVAKGINYTDYNDPNEIELTEEQYNTIQTPCKLVDGEFVPCEYPKSKAVEFDLEPTTEELLNIILGVDE